MDTLIRRSGSEDFRDDSPIEMARGGCATSTKDDEIFEQNALQIFIVYTIRLLSRQKLHTSQNALVPVRVPANFFLIFVISSGHPKISYSTSCW